MPEGVEMTDPQPSNGSQIRTFADCPDRVEDLWDLDKVEHKTLDPTRCPLSLRNSDYSECKAGGFCEISVRDEEMLNYINGDGP